MAPSAGHLTDNDMNEVSQATQSFNLETQKTLWTFNSDLWEKLINF
jgi:hypothetical protein